MKPSSNFGSASTAAVRASTATVFWSVGRRRRRRQRDEPEGRRRRLGRDTNCTTLRDARACATATTWSRLGARRAGRHRRRLDLGAEQVPDLVVKDQRQAGDAQQQHEDGADQAGPFVDPGPAADDRTAQCHLGLRRVVSGRVVPGTSPPSFWRVHLLARAGGCEVRGNGLLGQDQLAQRRLAQAVQRPAVFDLQFGGAAEQGFALDRQRCARPWFPGRPDRGLREEEQAACACRSV